MGALRVVVTTSAASEVFDTLSCTRGLFQWLRLLFSCVGVTTFLLCKIVGVCILARNLKLTELMVLASPWLSAPSDTVLIEDPVEVGRGIRTTPWILVTRSGRGGDEDGACSEAEGVTLRIVAFSARLNVLSELDLMDPPFLCAGTPSGR